MLKSYEAVIEENQIKWLGTPPQMTSARVIITVLSTDNEDEIASVRCKTKLKKRQLGFMQGEMTLPEDIHWGDQISKLFNYRNL